jgi:selenide, water dikinase
MDNDVMKLTQYSRGSGCGCKIAPKILEEILKSNLQLPDDDNLLVGNDTNDDAAVYRLGNGMALISTTDFFTPIVDDPFDFGRIAAANSISDVYAMGGKPLMAIAILGWPVDTLSIEQARAVIEGARSTCRDAGIMLAGGHSIDSIEPIFGLAVTGIVKEENIKRNNTAREGDDLYLTKPLGTGILSAAQKRDLLDPEHLSEMIRLMTTLNKAGEELGKINLVTAMTDVTGFGLLGHVVEMCEGSDCSVELFYSRIQQAPGTAFYINQRIFPDATTRNWNAYSAKVAFDKEVNVVEAFTLLPDPQTNGGILFTADPGARTQIASLLTSQGLASFAHPIGKMVAKNEKTVRVKA